jgi:hypothetical protein
MELLFGMRFPRLYHAPFRGHFKAFAPYANHILMAKRSLQCQFISGQPSDNTVMVNETPLTELGKGRFRFSFRYIENVL